MKHVLHVVGARPNFMKAAPVLDALRRRSPVRQTLVHTGQHYDANMSDVFFTQLGLPAPDVHLGIGAGSQTAQTAQIMMHFEEVVATHKPDIVLVYGDVNSTLAAVLVCAKMGVRVAHVEAGLRSFDRTMPEELNRIVVDQLADLLLTPSPDGDRNLLGEGVSRDRIRRVGNVMIDTLVRLLPKARMPAGVSPVDRYALVTLHRPSNVDELGKLQDILDALDQISLQCRVLFPVHPRTRQRMKQIRRIPCDLNRFVVLEPLGYLECLALQKNATVVITDSGGMQEETTYLGVPCLTLRENTERPITVEVGTNTLLGSNLRQLVAEVERVLARGGKTGKIPDLWDGRASERIADLVMEMCGDLTRPLAAVA